MPVGARRSLLAGLVSLCAVAGALWMFSAQALAAAPETPVNEKVKDITTTTATVEGELNPGGAGEAGEYEFVYRGHGSARCDNEEEGLAPEPPGVALGFKEEAVSAQFTGLQPNDGITFCLIERNARGEVGEGAPVSFKTLPAPPTVIGESAPAPKATEATLEAGINPNNEDTTYSFEYATKATGEKLEGTVEAIPGGPLPSSEFRERVVAASTGAVLAPNTTYYYRVLAENEQSEKEGKPAEGKVESFTTAIAPEAPEGEEAKPVTGTTAILHGVLNPHSEGNPGSYEFRYRQSAGECQGGEPGEEKSTPAVAETGHSPEPVEAEVKGLRPATTYTFCLLATNTVGETTPGAPVMFTTLVTPSTIVSESVSTVEATTATLEAEIVPDGAATTYRFEYGNTEAYGQSTPESASIGAGDTVQPATVRVSGLQPATTYHYRVVASNECEAGKECVTDGEDKTLTTSAVLGSAPPQHCENDKLRLEQPYGAGLPDCRAYEMVSPVETNGNDATDSFVEEEPRAAVSGEAVTYASRGSFADPTGSGVENQILARRGPSGWATQDIAPLHDPSRTENYDSYASSLFTPELTEGVVSTNAQLTSEAPPPADSLWGLYVDDFASGSYQLVGAGPFGGPGGINAVGASTDLSHVAFSDGSLSEWVNGKVIPVGVANNGESMPATAAGWRDVSSNGSRIFFTSSGLVYARENAEREQSALGGKGECTEAAKACTVAISTGPASYSGASTDGSKVFFREGEELYEYEVESNQTIALAGAVQGVAQISEDGSYVYFVAKSALKGSGGGTLRNGRGSEPVAGEDNLYLVHNETTQFVATLAGNDSDDWAPAFTPDLATDSAAVTPDGMRLAFMSERSLTGYDNEQAEHGECEGALERNFRHRETGRCQELYLYDAETESLECASCDPTGARPVGHSSLSVGSTAGGGGPFLQYRPRALAEDGVLFFDSSDALVPHASDGRQNVYEYEDGHLYAISNVAGGYESFFLDASANGDDVFFATVDQLLPEDTGNNVVVYDARVNGGFPVMVVPPPCDNGDSCKPPPTPQPAVFGAPASATFSGTGNAMPTTVAPTPKKSTKKAVRCAKGRKLSHGKCVEKKKSKRSRAKKSIHGKGSN